MYPHQNIPGYPGYDGASRPPINNHQYQQLPIQHRQPFQGGIPQMIPNIVQQGSPAQHQAHQPYTPPPVNNPQNYNQQSNSLGYNQPHSSSLPFHQQPSFGYQQPSFGNQSQQYPQQDLYMQHQQPVQRNPHLPGFNNPQQNMNNFSQSEHSEIQEFFHEVAGIDRNIDRREFIQVLVLAYPNLRNFPQLSGFAEHLFRQCDLNNNGYIDLNEFMNGYRQVSDQLENMNNQHA